MTHSQLVRSAALFAVAVASILICAKFIAWEMTNSLTLQASLIDSLLDGVASLLNFFIIKHALKPADKDHRFGHGKAEALGAMAQSAFIAGSALWLLIEVADRLIKPVQIGDAMAGNIVMGLATVLTFVLIAYQRHVIKKTRSLAINADSLHYQTDFLVNLVVIFSLNISPYLNWPRLDALLGGMISLYILYSAWVIAKGALDILMDKELPEKQREKIVSIVCSFPDVLGIHSLKTRSSGQKEFIQMHVDLPQDISLTAAHDISDMIEDKINQEFPHAEVLIHHDPTPEKRIKE